MSPTEVCVASADVLRRMRQRSGHDVACVVTSRLERFGKMVNGEMEATLDQFQNTGLLELAFASHLELICVAEITIKKS